MPDTCCRACGAELAARGLCRRCGGIVSSDCAKCGAMLEPAHRECLSKR